MDRALRVFAIIALTSLGLFMITGRILDSVQQQPAMVDNEPALLPPLVPSILVNFVGSTGSALCLAVGVAALVACIQRHQRRWAVWLVLLLVVDASVPRLVSELIPLLDNAQVIASIPYVGLLSSGLIAVVVLIYTFASRPRMSQQIQPTPVVE